MADYSSTSLLADAKQRYGEQLLRRRMAGSLADTAAADAELLEISDGVYDRVRTAARATVSWPLQGSDDAGTPYREKWPRNVFQRALELLNWRTQAGASGVTEEQRRIGLAAEKFFDLLAAGLVSWGIGVNTDVGTVTLHSARDRDGTALLAGVTDIETMHDTFRGRAWNG